MSANITMNGVVYVRMQSTHARKQALVDIIEMAKDIAQEFDSTDTAQRINVQVILEGIGVPLPSITELMKEVWPK